MPPRPSPVPKRLALLWLTASVALGVAGCHHVKPDLGKDRTVEAGVPVSLGSREPEAPAVVWDFGDGSPTQQAPRVAHAYARAGTYTARALQEGKEVGRVQLTVVPRPVLRAVPADAQTVLYLPQLHGNVEPLVDFYERLIGPDNARRTLEDRPLVPLVLRSLAGGPSVVDPDEGLGFFLLPDFDGVVALLGVTDVPGALEAVARELSGAGHRVMPQEDGSARVEPREGGRPMLLFADRGYLYLAVPDTEEEPREGEPVQARAEMSPALDATRDVDGVRRRVEGAGEAGVSESALLGELRGKVTPGSVYLYAATPLKAREDVGTVRGFFASLSVRPTELDLDGFLGTERPLLEGQSGPASALLGQGTLGPVAAAQLSVPPEELAKLVFGAPGSPRRQKKLERWQRQGLDADALLKALRGDVAMLVYFDAAAFYRNFLKNKQPAPKGTVVMEAGLTASAPVLDLLTKQLQDSTLRYDTQALPDGTRFRTQLMEQPVELTITSKRATLMAGELLMGRPTGDVGGALRERFGGGAFGPGHVSLMVDLGRLRADLSSQREVPGVPQAQLLAAQAFVGALLDQLTPLDHGFLDFTPAEGGGRLKGRIVLREH